MLIVLCAYFFAPHISFAQYRHHYDHKRFNFGFMMGISYNRYLMKSHRNIFDDGRLLEEVDIIPKPGLNIGMINNLMINDKMCVRFIPAVSLEERHFAFHFTDTTERRRVESAYLDFPLLFQVRSALYNGTRLYVVSGPEFSINFQSNKKIKNDPTLIKVQSTCTSWVIGVGYNLYGDRIKLSPEFRYSIGFTNDYVPLNTSHSVAISRLFRQVITINVLFE
ncbi:MAG: porin family protein [Bacteroidia bacterium]